MPTSFDESTDAVPALDVLALALALGGADEGLPVAALPFPFVVTAMLAGAAVFAVAAARFVDAAFELLDGFVQPPSKAVISPTVRIAIVLFIPLARLQLIHA